MLRWMVLFSGLDSGLTKDLGGQGMMNACMSTHENTLNASLTHCYKLSYKDGGTLYTNIIAYRGIEDYVPQSQTIMSG